MQIGVPFLGEFQIRRAHLLFARVFADTKNGVVVFRDVHRRTAEGEQEGICAVRVCVRRGCVMEASYVIGESVESIEMDLCRVGRSEQIPRMARVYVLSLCRG